ncbi:N-acetylmuramoyl-L-alanine amidase [Virgibacillus ndiopensis]|uniref:N-acetylmuramoyl-L-alanine amidase n=1 Tax=Virgibacillus ndiopensis TaxID=2004408 RepID=UPI00159BE64E|nr:N-acetylmuramoyl-L-alanine amidase [Virgibacillus ndiopensis]
MRITTTIVLFLTLFLLFQTIVNASEALVNTDNLNVRSGPGTDHKKIGQVHTDQKYPVLQRQNGWVEIQLENSTGWITDDYITISGEDTSSVTSSNSDDASKTKSDSKENKSITIQYENTHIRKGPSTDYEITDFVNKGEKFDVISETNEWYEISNGEIKGFIFKPFVDKKSSSFATGLKSKTIVIDAGHGGRDVGAIGASGSYEKNVAYKTAMELKQELSILGAEVVLTRKNDEFIALGSRTSLANIVDADAFISIHYNSVPTLPNVTGIGTYYYYDQNKNLAKFIQQEVIKETNAKDRGITFGDFHVIRQTFKPGVLVELGFMSNLEKEQLLLTDAYQKKLVKGIVNGFAKYFGNRN